MIEKNEEISENSEGISRIKLIAQRRKFLEKKSQEEFFPGFQTLICFDLTCKVREEIRNCFSQLREVLESRESQLLRQVEAIYRQQITLSQRTPDFLPTVSVILHEKDSLESQIRSFARLELESCSGITSEDPYRIEEYQEIDKDHVSLEKAIEDTSQGRTCQETLSDVTENQAWRKRTSHRNELRKNFSTEEIFYADTERASLRETAEAARKEKRMEEGHSEQVQQWLEQILRQTETEPVIHEVDKLPTMKFQVET